MDMRERERERERGHSVQLLHVIEKENKLGHDSL
jgi:hypothetical protein